MFLAKLLFHFHIYIYDMCVCVLDCDLKNTKMYFLDKKFYSPL